MSVYYQDDTVTLHLGDSLEVLRTLPDQSVDCCVTSPPYFGLRDYGVAGQIGAEKSPTEYVERLRVLLAEVRRVLVDDGTCWVVLGDTFNSTSSGQNSTGATTMTGGEHDRLGGRRSRLPDPALPTKNLLGVPWRVAFALQDDGWILRSAICWNKVNALPESMTDRLSTRYEMVFLFSKSQRYWFDLDPIREPHAQSTVDAASRARIPYTAPGQRTQAKTRAMNAVGANPGDVWSISTVPFTGARIARLHPDHHGLDEPSYGMRRIASPTCPLHASADRQGSSDPDDGHAVALSSGTPDIDVRPVPTRADGFAPTQSQYEQSSVPNRSDSSVLDSSGSARSRSNGNHRKVRDPATSQPYTPSARTQSGTEHIGGQYGFDLPDPHISESSKAADGLVDRVGTASSKHDKCSCSWANNTEKLDHFATFPPELPRRCISAGCKPSGTVLDPFSGSGTTGMVAQKLGRKYVGIDLNPDYLALSLRTRLADQAMEFPA